MPIQNSTLRVAEPPPVPVEQPEAPASSKTANKVSQFFTRIEGMITVFALLAGAATALLWGVPLGLIAGSIGLAVAAVIVLCRATPEPIEDIPPIVFSTPEAMEAAIRAMTLAEIDFIAKHISGQILDLLIPNIHGNEYDPNSDLFHYLVPFVAFEIRRKRQDPHAFIDGLTLPIFDVEEDSADAIPILTKIKNAYGYSVENLVDNLMERLNKSDLLLDLRLTLDVPKTENTTKLSFSLQILTDDEEGNQPYKEIGKINFTIDECERLAKEALVR